jgi:hypothetical protein
MPQSPEGSRFRGFRVVLPAVVLLCAGLAAAKAAVAHGREDAYILSFGNSMMISSVSIEEYDRLRAGRAGDFLWIRRAGNAYVVEDPATLKEARALFSSPNVLEPEQEALRRRQEALDDKEQELDQQEEEIDRRMDADSGEDDEDDDAPQAAPVSTADQKNLERQMSDIRSRQREIESSNRDLESVERDLDAREEEIEREAESKLWSLIDGAIKSGVAKPI